MFDRRVTILVGHFGSGKTEIAVSGVLDLAARGESAALVDLDVVKPYFRSRASREFLAEAGVRLVAPEGEDRFADLPILVPQVRAVLDPATGLKVVMDAGGDDTGARIVGSLSDRIRPDETDVLLVLNFRRPFTEDARSAVEMASDISAAARIPFTGVVSNTHLMDETTPEVIEEGYTLARETATLLRLPVVGVTVAEILRPRLDEARFECPVVGLRRVVRPPFEDSPRVRRTGPLFVLN
jgi:Mrp family chromosome partitioning ATPase